jgi:hypothetical protein
MTHPIADAHPPPAWPAADGLLAGLTPEQTKAVCHGAGPLLLIAGPGAGKTKTLIHRIARLLATGAAHPWEILAVTFSVRAAGELRLRLADLLGEHVARGVTAATFHSICARMLREHAAVFARTEQSTIYDEADMRRVIEWLLSDQHRGQIQQALADHGQPAASEVLAEISLAKEPAPVPRQLRAGGATRRGAADRRRLAGSRRRAAALQLVGLRRPARVCGGRPRPPGAVRGGPGAGSRRAARRRSIGHVAVAAVTLDGGLVAPTRGSATRHRMPSSAATPNGARGPAVAVSRRARLRRAAPRQPGAGHARGSLVSPRNCHHRRAASP